MRPSPQSTIDAARRSLLAYAVLQNPNYEIANHHIRIARALEAVERGEIKRLIITVPPRHGKSMLVSQYFPAWYTGRNPSKYIITATYGQDLASDFGRKVRNQLQDPGFKAVFPKAVLKNDSQAANRFEVDAGGQYFAVGVGGPATGRGGDLLLVDDPTKSREEADSAVMREKVKEWYRAVAYTRLMSGGAVIIVMTRWHEDDLVGYVLREHPHENWTVITLPAISEEGQALWPEKFPIQQLHAIRATLHEYDWHCLYQQNPIPKEGNLFRASWLEPGLPANGQFAAKFMAVDPAISKKEGADETAITVFGVGYGNPAIYYEIETLHGNWDFPEIIQNIQALYAQHRPSMVGVESVAFQKALGDVLTVKGLPVFEMKVDGDKRRRAMSVTHLFSQGRVKINGRDAREQLLRFRGVDGDRDDIVDAIVHCLTLIKQASSEHYVEAVDRYKGMHPDSAKFYREENNDMPGRGRGDDSRSLFGF